MALSDVQKALIKKGLIIGVVANIATKIFSKFMRK
jgi:multisubunit Na+/H+ antiporter MnhF subunit